MSSTLVQKWSARGGRLDWPGHSARQKRLRGLYGAYRFLDGRLVSIRASVQGTLRSRDFETGQSRRLYPRKRDRFVSGPGFSVAAPVDLEVSFDLDHGGNAASLQWKAQGRPVQTAVRVGRTRSMTFTSGDTRLFGRLDLPDSPGPHPAIVLVHGSGKDAATDFYFTADFYAAHGIAALTFDKRGTGRSQGRFTMDYQQLARDVVAGVDCLRGRSDIDSGRIGLAGYSQGGWVAPLAASQTDQVRYVIVNCGMIESPAEEARLETLILVRKRGVTEGSALREIEALTVASVHIVASGFRTGWEEFEALKAQYAGAAWRRSLQGSPVARFMQYPRRLIQWIGPLLSPPGLDWHYSSEAVLASLDVPMLWLLGAADEEAPNELTIPKLRGLQAAGKPIDLIVFAGAEHGLLVFEEENGGRQCVGYAPGCFAAEVNYARQQSGLRTG